MTVPVPDPQQVREFMETYVAQARAATRGMAQPGLLQMVRVHPLDETLVPYRYSLDDKALVERMTKDAIDASKDGHNVYIEARTIRPGLTGKQRGEFADTVAVFAEVVDSDSDKGMAWTPTAPVSLSVETSSCNAHHWLFLARAVDAACGKALGERLRAATKTDHDTGVITQPYRVAGTVNYPTREKLARGRVVAATRILGFDPETLWTPKRFDDEFPALPPKSNGPAEESTSTADMDENSIPADTMGAIQNGVEDPLRSDVFWNVVVVLRRTGWTVDGIAALLGRYPNGIARKYRGRLQYEVERVCAKLGKKKQADTHAEQQPAKDETPALVQYPPRTLGEVHSAFVKWFGKDFDLDAIDAVMAAAASERLAGDPLWLLVVGGPGGAKTETVQALMGAGAHVTSTITSEGALLSATPRRERNKKATGGLLRKIGNRGVIVIKDVTSILSADRNIRGTVLAAVREIYDGRWERNVGSDGGQTLTWTGRIVIIGAVTTAWDAAHAVVSTMGDRFVLIRPRTKEGRQGAGKGAIRHTGTEANMREELAAAVGGLIGSMNTEPHQLTDGEVNQILNAADIVTMARSAIERDFKGEVVFAHDPEMPTRFAKQLTQMLRGAVAIGMTAAQGMRLAMRCARDSIPPLRREILLDLASNPNSRTVDVRRRIDKPRNTVRIVLESLHMLGLLQCEEEDVTDSQGKKRAVWRYSLAEGFDADTLKTMADHPVVSVLL